MLSAREMAERSGLPFTTIRSRLHEGMTPEEAMHKPIARPRRFDFHGEKLTFKEVAERTGIDWGVLRNRVYSGMTMERAASYERPAPRKSPSRRKRTPEDDRRAIAIKHAAREAGVKVNTIHRRLLGGLTLEEARTRPAGAKRSIDPFAFIDKVRGDLTVTDVRYDHGWLVDCTCKCGNKTSIKASAFSAGQRKSCGCARWRTGPREDLRKKYALADGRSLTAIQLAEISGINIGTIKSRIEKQGMTSDAAIETPVRRAASLVGQTFGRLRILGHVGNKVEWVCACGKAGSSDRYNVTSGGSRSCGCSKYKKAPGPLVDRAGQTMPSGIKILRLAPEKVKNHRGLWVCQCPRCGAEFEATFEKVRDALSCGCSNPRRKKQLDVFGAKLTLLELAHISGTDRTVISDRIQQRGVTPAEAAFGSFKPRRRERRWIQVDGEMLTTNEAAERAGICTSTFWTRYRRLGLEPGKIVATGPPRPHKLYERRSKDRA